MNLCTGSGLRTHEEICYDHEPCPICDLLSTVADLEYELEKDEAEIAELHDSLDSREYGT